MNKYEDKNDQISKYYQRFNCSYIYRFGLILSSGYIYGMKSTYYNVMNKN